ncbi:MAG TPA: hypothetical protein VHW23_26120 [Kofleriaceae bacterium]|nr:hypothetical protein [Kofleriaceae bacterium]
MAVQRGMRCIGLVLGLALCAASPACGKKTEQPAGPAPELTGLAVVPASADVVVGADIAKLSGSPIIDRAVEQLLTRDATLSDRWQRLKDECKLDLGKQIKRVMLALGPSRPGPAPGTGPVLMVAVGSVPETELQQCVTKLVGAGGGSLTGKPVLGRTMYLAKDGNRTMSFAYTRPDTVVLSADEAYLTEAMGSGKKAPDNPDLTAWRKLVNQSAPLWAVGRTDARIRDGLVHLTEGKISAGPVAFALSADLGDGARLQLSAVMNQPDQAKALESYVKGELALLGAAAQLKSLGSVVGKVTVTAEGNVVQFRAALTVDDLNHLLSVLDGDSPPPQNRAPLQPSPGSGAQ